MIDESKYELLSKVDSPKDIRDFNNLQLKQFVYIGIGITPKQFLILVLFLFVILLNIKNSYIILNFKHSLKFSIKSSCRFK